MTDFQSAFYRDVQPFSGGWTFLLGALGEFTRSSLIFSRKFQSFENFNFSLNFSSTTAILIYIISNFSGEEYARIL
jgi:hypothetical protein